LTLSQQGGKCAECNEPLSLKYSEPDRKIAARGYQMQPFSFSPKRLSQGISVAYTQGTKRTPHVFDLKLWMSITEHEYP
jgi:hypothetical protein